MQTCEVYLRKGSVYVVSQSHDAAGIGLSVGPMFKVEKNNPGEVGKVVIAALDASRQGISTPPDFGRFQKELLGFLGAKNFGEVTKSSMYLGIARDGAKVTIVPYRVAAGGGFEPEGSGTAYASASVEEVGRRVLEALKLADPPSDRFES